MMPSDAIFIGFETHLSWFLLVSPENGADSVDLPLVS